MTAIFTLHGADLTAWELLRDAPGFAKKLNAPTSVREALVRAVAWVEEERQTSVLQLRAELAHEPIAAASSLPTTPRPKPAAQTARPSRSTSRSAPRHERQFAELLSKADYWQERSQARNCATVTGQRASQYCESLTVC